MSMDLKKEIEALEAEYKDKKDTLIAARKVEQVIEKFLPSNGWVIAFESPRNFFIRYEGGIRISTVKEFNSIRRGLMTAFPECEVPIKGADDHIWIFAHIVMDGKEIEVCCSIIGRVKTEKRIKPASEEEVIVAIDCGDGFVSVEG